MPACYRGALFMALMNRLAPESKHGNFLSSGDRRILRRRSRGVLAALFAQPIAGIVRPLCGAGADLAPSFEYQLTHGGRRSERSIKRHRSYFSRKCQDQFRIQNSEYVELRMRRVPDASNSECVECQLSTVWFRSVLVELKIDQVSRRFLANGVQNGRCYLPTTCVPPLCVSVDLDADREADRALTTRWATSARRPHRQRLHLDSTQRERALRDRDGIGVHSDAVRPAIFVPRLAWPPSRAVGSMARWLDGS